MLKGNATLTALELSINEALSKTIKANRAGSEIKAEYVKSVIKFSNQRLFKESITET